MRHQIQLFSPCAPIQKGTYFHTNSRSLLESQVLDFTHAIKAWVYRISNCQQFWHTPSVLSWFSGKIISSEEEVGTTVEPSYVTCFFLHCTQKALISYNFFFFHRVLNGSQLPHDCHVIWSHVIITPPVKWPHMIGKICVKMPSKLRKNQESNGFSSRGIPSYRPELLFILQPKG